MARAQGLEDLHHARSLAIRNAQQHHEHNRDTSWSPVGRDRAAVPEATAAPQPAHAGCAAGAADPAGPSGRQVRLGGRRTPSRASWNCCCVDRLCCCSSTRFTVNSGSVIGSVTVSDSLSARRHTQNSAHLCAKVA